MKIMKLLIIPAVLFAGCNSKKDQGNSDDITGTYVMEKTYEVRHEATGEPVGMASLRDTIIIRKINDGYEVKNRKWKKNEFDEEGWVRMMHDASPTFRAKHEASTRILDAQPTGSFPALEIGSDRLFKGKNRVQYQKKKI